MDHTIFLAFFSSMHQMISLLDLMSGDPHLLEDTKSKAASAGLTTSLSDASLRSSQSSSSTSFFPMDVSSPTNTKTKSQDICSGIGHKDIYCGRDRYSHSHPGNRHFRQLIIKYRERYQSAKHREDKTKINAEIVELVKRTGGRFMRWDDTTGRWQELDASSAHEKISHALRSAKDPNRPKEPKKKRQVAIKPPSDEEERAFQVLAADQQEIFRQLQEATDSYQHDHGGSINTL